MGTSKQQVESLMPSPAAASDHTSPAPLAPSCPWGLGWRRWVVSGSH